MARVTGGHEDGFVKYAIIPQSFPESTRELRIIFMIEAQALHSSALKRCASPTVCVVRVILATHTSGSLSHFKQVSFNFAMTEKQISIKTKIKGRRKRGRMEGWREGGDLWIQPNGGRKWS